MRTGDDRVWAPIPAKRVAVRKDVATKRPILTVQSFWQRIDPRPDEK